MGIPLDLLLQIANEHLHANGGGGLDGEIVDTASARRLASLLVKVNRDAMLTDGLGAPV